MYIFKIIEVIDRSKAWYKGEVFGDNTFENVTVTNPIGYEAAGVMMGETNESAGFLYTSLIDNNLDDPAYNYVGYPSEQTSWSGKNTWLRSGYANRTKMLTPESGGITESFGEDMSGTLSIPSGSIPNGMYNDANACTCCLFYGVLGASITINGQTIGNLDVDYNGWRLGYGDPELTDLNKAITVSTLDTHSFGWRISVPPATADVLSTYCAGCYLGSWSYIGRTQWTDHKKSVNDYSRQEQDEWGNYSLSKGRVGRTYSAEVILTTRKDAVLGDYDYDITSLCASVVQLLRTCLGTPMAFYFNNQDIGCPWIPHNVPLGGGTPVLLNNSDIIVGILQNCEITDIQGDRAVLKMSVNSVPNEYQNYNDVSGITPSIAPPLPESIAIPMCTDVVFANMITGDELSNGDSIALELTTQEWTNVISLTPTPSDAPIKILSVEAYSYTQITIGWVPDPSGYSDYIFTVEGKGDPAFEWENVPLEGSEGIIIRMRGLTSGIGDKKNFLKIQTARWDTTSNTYGYGEMFYLDNVGTTVTSG